MSPFERRLAKVEKARAASKGMGELRVLIPPGELTLEEQEAWHAAQAALLPAGSNIRRVLFVPSGEPDHDGPARVIH